MKEANNVQLIAKLQPDFLGFIFWEKSPRFCVEVPKNIPKNIQKVGVFVNASFDFILEKIKTFDLQAVQLHGQEAPKICAKLKLLTTVIKVFSIKDRFDFSELSPYEAACDYYLFDTKGKLPGGNGEEFDWEVLRSYPSQKPFFLSVFVTILTIFASSSTTKIFFRIIMTPIERLGKGAPDYD